MTNLDIMSDIQRQLMNAVRDKEDRQIFWQFRISEMASAADNRPPIEAIYLLILKYGANAKSTKRSQNVYEIELECNECTHGDWAFQYFLRPCSSLRGDK